MKIALSEFIRSPRASLHCRQLLKEQDIKLGFSWADLRSGKLLLEPVVSISKATLALQNLKVGTRTYLRSACELLNISTIGRFCSIGNKVILGQGRSDHPLDWVSTHPFQHERPERHYHHVASPTEIGNDVWIGREAIVMEGVRIGTGAVIGARAVVTRDVPPYAVVVGVPAHIIRYRHTSEIIDKLLQSEWWTLPIDFLESTPLESPTLFLECLSKSPKVEQAQYPCIELTKTHCRLLAPLS